MDDDWRIHEARTAGPVSHELVFSEDVTALREDLVVEAVEFLRGLPGVTTVERVDREAIALATQAVPTGQLTEAVRSWWAAAKQRRTGWMVAMDRTAQTVSGLAGAHGFQLRDWELTRVLDPELTQVISLHHRFGEGPGEHTLIVTAYLTLTLPDVQHRTVANYCGDLGDEAALISAVTGRILPALQAVSTVDVLVEQSPDPELHARLLAARGRLAEARELYQQEFERSTPQQRPVLLQLVERLGVPPLTTAADARLSVAEEATLAAWQANTTTMTGRLSSLSEAGLDGTRGSLDGLWAWLRDSRDRLEREFGDAAPVLAVSYYGMRIGNDIRQGRVPFQPWYRVTVELVTAYVGGVVAGMQPGTAWGVAGDGELSLVHHSGTGLLSRVFTIAHTAFGAPVEEFDPYRLRRLADDLVRWVNDPSNRAFVVRLV